MEKILALCKEINLPVEMVQKVEVTAKTLDIAPFAEHMEALLSEETAKGAYEAIASVLDSMGGDQGGYILLTIYLITALRTREMYAEKGIEDSIFIETIKSLTRFSLEHKVTFDEYGFDRAWWMYRHLSLNLFRLGVLEFEMKHEDDILSVHIPSDAIMTREALDASYAWAKRFFAEYFSHFSNKSIECNTWLLSPSLKNLLPTGSKILNFAADYEILSSEPDAQSFMMWVYKKEYPDIDSLPEDTSLQRAIKRHLHMGGKIGDARGKYTQEQKHIS